MPGAAFVGGPWDGLQLQAIPDGAQVVYLPLPAVDTAANVVTPCVYRCQNVGASLDRQTLARLRAQLGAARAGCYARAVGVRFAWRGELALV